MRLYDYARSTAAYRVRIALNLKGLVYDSENINLLDSEELQPEYLQRNPQGLVPSLELDDGTVLTQSMAICEYLDDAYPDPALLPSDPIVRAQVRAFAQVISCDIHPLNNLRVLKYLTGPLSVSRTEKLDWYHHWIAEGFTTLEIIARKQPDTLYCFGDTPTLADIFLAAQMFNARRFECDLAYPRLVEITEGCEALDAFHKAHPEV